MTYHRSSVWPLAWTCAALIIYASLHPFSNWQLSGPLSPALLKLPWVYFTPRFDIQANFLAYVPLAFLTCTGWRREDEPPWSAWLRSTLQGCALSYSMEVIQHALPTRVPSMLDWLMNTAGAATGATLGLVLHRWHVVDTLRGWRNRWIVHGSGGGQTLLLLWPLGLLFPPAVPLGLGQVLPRLIEGIQAALDGTPYAGWAPELQEFDPLAPGSELLVVALGLLAPTLVAYTLTRLAGVRIVVMFGATLLGMLVTTISTTLNFGPDHAMSWLTEPVAPGLAAGAATGIVLAWLPRRVLAGMGLVVLTALCALINQAPADPYFSLSLQAWEQGRFIRFHGLAQWIGWLWPYMAMLWLLTRLAAKDG